MEDPSPVPARRRLTDDERNDAVRVLQAATVDGSLDLDELGQRIELVFRARTADDLALVTRDLPAAHRPPQPTARRRPDPRQPERRSVWHNTAFRIHSAAYGLTNGFLVGVWALTGGDMFWPFFPAAAWGIGLGVHAVATASYEEHQAQRAALKAGRQEERPSEQPELARPQSAAPRSSVSSSARSTPIDRVAVLFADIVGSTQLTAALGDIGWSQARARHRELVATCLADHHGTEVSVQGDGVLARFPDEVAAVRSAVDIQRALDRQREHTGFAPRVRIGVHAGEAVADGLDLVGNVINLAARVTSEADPDEVLVTESVAERVGDRFPVEDRGLRRLKGIAQPRHLLAVDWR